MARTVEYGIDLGTTNSAVARMTTKGVEIIPVERASYVRSAVSKRRGALKVGQAALNDPEAPRAEKFKRLMGETESIVVGQDETMTPVQLSAEVLKELKRAVKRRYDEDLVDVVITVPAMFNQPQCAATQEAAAMAGLNTVVLLQEPIAAATAYLSDDPTPGYYLVYDLGGGTFDVSLVRLLDGEMQVIAHGGDNYLGGSDFDLAIYQWVVDQVERKGGDKEKFEQERDRRRLLQIVEETRIDLSDADSALIDLGDFDLPIPSLKISCSQLEDLIEELVDKTIRITRERISKANLKSEDIESVLLVGGPTQMPYIRKRLQKEIGIRLNLDQDPMTVVAKGAALHAGGLLRDQSKPKPKSSTDTVQLELHYEPISPQTEQLVAAKVISEFDLDGEVQISSVSGDWQTGWIRLKRGAFSATISIGKDQMREFVIALRDKAGTLAPCEPNRFTVIAGVRSAAPVVPYNYGVVLEDGQKLGVVVKEGGSLPASNTEIFKLSKTLVAGSPEEATIYFVEGHSTHAPENIAVGSLRIQGTDLKRTLPENSPIEVRIRVDESRIVTAKVYIPLLDEEYSVTCHSSLERVDPIQIANKIRRTQTELAEIEDVVSENDRDELLQIGRDLEQLEAVAERAEEGHQGESGKAHKHLTDAKSRLRSLQDKYLNEARYNGLIEFISEADALCAEFNDNLGRARLKELKQDAEKARRLDHLQTLDEIWDRVREIFWVHYQNTRACWEGFIDWLRHNAELARDPLSFMEFLHRAEQALMADDFEGTRLNVWRAKDLIEENATAPSEFINAALRK